jgi:hypothetical protein
MFLAVPSRVATYEEANLVIIWKVCIPITILVVILNTGFGTGNDGPSQRDMPTDVARYATVGEVDAEL